MQARISQCPRKLTLMKLPRCLNLDVNSQAVLQMLLSNKFLILEEVLSELIQVRQAKVIRHQQLLLKILSTTIKTEYQQTHLNFWEVQEDSLLIRTNRSNKFQVQSKDQGKVNQSFLFSRTPINHNKQEYQILLRCIRMEYHILLCQTSNNNLFKVSLKWDIQLSSKLKVNSCRIIKTIKNKCSRIRIMHSYQVDLIKITNSRLTPCQVRTKIFRPRRINHLSILSISSTSKTTINNWTSALTLKNNSTTLMNSS